MKFIILAVLCYAIVLEAYPFDGYGLVGKEIGTGVGNGVGVGLGTGVGMGLNGVEAIGTGALGLSLGAVQLGSGLIQGVGSGLVNGLGAGLGLAGIGGGSQIKNSHNRQRRGEQRYNYPRQRQGPSVKMVKRRSRLN